VLFCLIGHCCWASGESALYALTTQWSSFAGSQFGTDEIYSLATDSSTNLYFGGKLGSGGFFCSDGSDVSFNYLLGTPSSDSAYVAKTDKDGNLKWVSTLCYSGDGSEYGGATYGLASTDGAIYVAATAKNWEYVYEGIDYWLKPWDEALLLKINVTNGTEVWRSTLTSLSLGGNYYNTTSGFKAVAVDPSGSIYAVGYTTLTNLSSSSSFSGGKDAVVVKYSAAGSNIWVRYLGGSNNDEANAVSIGPDGLYVSGTTWSPGSWITRGSTNLPSASKSCGFLSKIDFNGTNVFYTMVLGGSTNDAILSMQSVSNTIFLAGTTYSANFCSGYQTNSYGGFGDGFVLKLTDINSTCQTNWFRYVGTNTVDAVHGLTLMDSNRVVVCGSTQAGDWLPESDEISNLYKGATDGFILQLDRQSGAPKWSTYLGDTNNETAYALAASGSSLFVGGQTASSRWVMSYGFPDPGDWSTIGRPVDSVDATGFVGRWSQEPGVPPSITNNLSEFVEVHEGESVSFIVHAQSMPSAKYYWLTNGVAVGGVSTNRYFIASALPRDNDTTYQCIASNVFGSATSHVARLSVIANGILDVSLSPNSAVTNGAVWQLTGGVWRASGPIALYPGPYTIAFTNLPGWTTPATQEVYIVAGQTTTVTAVYSAPVATAVRTVTNWTNVSLTVTCPTEVTSWTLVENLPVYVTPTNYFSGVWNGTSRTLTYTGAGASTLTYTTLISTNGDFAVSGVITSMPINVTMSTGTNNVSRGAFLRKIVGTNVCIYMFAPTTVKQWSVYEDLSTTSLQASNVSNGGGFLDGWIYWGGTSIGAGLELTYTVSGPPGSTNFLVNGSASVTFPPPQINYTVFGDSVVIIPPLPSEPPPPPTILSFFFNGTTASLTFTSVVSQAYMVVTNANLSVTNGWQNCVQKIGTGPTTTVEVPVVSPQLFYRVKIE
jgi:hypothetical protein